MLTMLTALATLVIPALMPAVADGMKGLFGKFFGSAEPVNVDDKIKLMGAEVQKLTALAALDTPIGVPSQWVCDLKSSFRYIAAGIIILFTLLFCGLFFALCAYDPTNKAIDTVVSVLEILLQMAGSVFSFLFGDRLYFNLKAPTKK
jgi:hypothetical protein